MLHTVSQPYREQAKTLIMLGTGSTGHLMVPSQDRFDDFPISMLPPLPARSSKYYWEPLIAVVMVSLLIVDCVGVPTVAARSITDPFMHQVVVPAVWIGGVIAAAGTASIILGPTGEIDRKESTCYPIPPDVKFKLEMGGMQNLGQNIPGVAGYTYCTRCFVWRPHESHHCSICQRCVTGFDHHCSFFGRCITVSNMPCFFAVIATLFVGLLAQGITFLFVLTQGTPLFASAPEALPTTPPPVTYFQHSQPYQTIPR